MKIEEKRLEKEDFIEREIGWASFYSLYFFRINIRYMIRLFEVEQIMLDKVEKGEIWARSTKEELDRTKHLILIDCLSKLMIATEGLIVLCSAVCGRGSRKKEISERMAWYIQQDINSFIENFQRGMINIWNMTGLPDCKRLKRNCGLSSEESKLIWNLFEGSNKVLRSEMMKIINFYQKNRIIYGKFKHGLTLLLGLAFTSQDKAIPHQITVVMAHDKKEPALTCFKAKGTVPSGYGWVNTMSILPYWKETFEEYMNVASIIEEIITYIVGNHLLWAMNCGEDYFPFDKESENYFAGNLIKSLTLQNQIMYESAKQKILANMYSPDVKYDVKLGAIGQAKDRIVKCLQQDNVANIFFESAQAIGLHQILIKSSSYNKS